MENQGVVRVSYITPTKHPRPQNGESRRPTISRGTIGDLPAFERGRESMGWWSSELSVSTSGSHGQSRVQRQCCALVRAGKDAVY